MTATDTRTHIISTATSLFARFGYEGVSMRTLAKECGIALSVTYHYFENKDALLKQMFEQTNTSLGKARQTLPQTTSAHEMLKQRIGFQVDHVEEVVAVLKYYLTFRTSFPKSGDGFVPEKAYLHILEVLDRGVATGEFVSADKPTDAKVITHAINGFLLEYYPHRPEGAEKEQLVNNIYHFISRALIHQQP